MNYAHTYPDSKKAGGTVGSQFKRNNVAQGSHRLQLCELNNVKWSKDELSVGEEIEAQVEVLGVADGTEILFTFYEANLNAGSRLLQETKSSISGGKAKVKVKYLTKATGAVSSPLIYFNVAVKGISKTSRKIPVYADLKIWLENDSGASVANEKVEVTLNNGVLLFGTTDGSGVVVFKKVPPCQHKVCFPDSPQVESADTTNGSPAVVIPYKPVIAGPKVNHFREITLYFYCLHKIDDNRRSVIATDLFEVVPDYKGKDAYQDEVRILSKVARSLQVQGKLLEEGPKEFGMSAYVLKCKQDFGEKLPTIWKGDFWKGLITPKEYQITGLPKPVTIKCYRPDIFKLQIQFPALRKWTGGTKVESEASQFVHEVKNHRPRTASSWENKKLTEGWQPKWPRPISSEMPITFLKNDQQITLDFLETVGAVIELGNKVSDILSLIQENVPQVGWYFTYENQFLQGTFVADWGWKEYKDHRAYYYVGLNIDIKLIELKFELGIGVSGFSCKLQIYGCLSGAVTLSLKGSRISPDGELEASLPFTAEIIASLGARAQAGYFIKLEGTVETGLKLDEGALKFSPHTGFSLGCSLKWSGITAKLVVSGGVGKKEGSDVVTQKKPDFNLKEKDHSSIVSDTSEHKIVGSKDLGKWEMCNSNYKYKPACITREELHDMLMKKLTAGDNIRVKTGVRMLGMKNKYLEIEDVANQIEDVIHARNDIRRDPKTAEAMVFDIRKKLESLIYENKSALSFAHMEEDRFILFRNNRELKSILDKYIDPFQAIIRQYS